MEIKLLQNSSVQVKDHNGNAIATINDDGSVKVGNKDVATKEYVDTNAPITDLVFESIKFISYAGTGSMRGNYPSSLGKKLDLANDGLATGDFLQYLCICFKSKPIHEKLLTEIENNRLVIRFDYPVNIRRNNGGAGRRSFCFEKQHYKNKHEGLIYRVKTTEIKTNRFGEKYVEVIRPLNEFMTDIVIQQGGLEFSCIDIESHLFEVLFGEREDDFNRPAWCKTLKSPVSIKPKTIGTNPTQFYMTGYYYLNDYSSGFVGNYPIYFNYMNGDKPKTLLERYYQEVCFSLNVNNDLAEGIITANDLPLRLKKHANYGNEHYDTSSLVNGWYYFPQNRLGSMGRSPHVLHGDIKRKNKFVVKPRFAILTEENIEDLPTRQSPIWKKTFPQSQQQIQIYMPSINILEEDYDVGNYGDYFAIAQVSITPL